MKNDLARILSNPDTMHTILGAIQVLESTGIFSALLVERSRIRADEPLTGENHARLANLTIYQMGYRQAFEDITNPKSTIDKNLLKTEGN